MHRFVQFFLQFTQQCALLRLMLGGQRFEHLGVAPLILDVLKAEEATKAVALQVTQCRIHADPVQPGEESGFALEPIDGTEGFDEGLLCQVCRILPVGGQVVDDTVQTLAVLAYKHVKCGHITRLDSLNKELVLGGGIALSGIRLKRDGVSNWFAY